MKCGVLGQFGCVGEPYWDGSMMIHTGSKNEEQSNESYASYDNDSATKEEEQKLKATAQQPLIKAGKQLTLHDLPSSTKRDSEAVEGHFRIFTLGSFYHDARLLLSTIGRSQEDWMKVAQSIDGPEQNLPISDEQLTLQALHRSAKRDSGTEKGHFGILALGPSHLSLRTLLYIEENPCKSVVKVTQSADDQNKTEQHCWYSTDQVT